MIQKKNAVKDSEPPDQPPGPPTSASASRPQFPAPHADGSHWTDEEHAEAVAAYLRAVEDGDPDAGRMRTVLSLFKHPQKGIGERIKI